MKMKMSELLIPGNGTLRVPPGTKFFSLNSLKFFVTHTMVLGTRSKKFDERDCVLYTPSGRTDMLYKPLLISIVGGSSTFIRHRMDEVGLDCLDRNKILLYVMMYFSFFLYHILLLRLRKVA